MKLKKFLSRKLIVAILAPIATAYLSAKGASPETIQWLLGLFGVYIGGQSAVDFASRRVGHPTE